MNKELFKNPILPCDYSDPDIIRAGHDYFMTASSFTNAPALPILHSTNLVDWKLVNYAFLAQVLCPGTIKMNLKQLKHFFMMIIISNGFTLAIWVMLMKMASCLLRGE